MAGILNITRYIIKNEKLAPWVKFIWRLDAPGTGKRYKILPTDCIDIILVPGGGMVYERGLEMIEAPLFHINGLRNTHSFVCHKWPGQVWGISFYAYGFFPFLNKSMQGLDKGIFDLYGTAPLLAERLAGINELSGPPGGRMRLEEEGSGGTEGTAASIERVLLEILDCRGHFQGRAQMIADFLSSGTGCTVQGFCKTKSVSVSTFERTVLHYTGFTPKALQDIRRFQDAGNQLVKEPCIGLARIAYDNDFVDQAHFTKTFRRYSGTPPYRFTAERASVKENAGYTYV